MLTSFNYYAPFVGSPKRKKDLFFLEHYFPQRQIDLWQPLRTFGLVVNWTQLFLFYTLNVIIKIIRINFFKWYKQLLSGTNIWCLSHLWGKAKIQWEILIEDIENYSMRKSCVQLHGIWKLYQLIIKYTFPPTRLVLLFMLIHL